MTKTQPLTVLPWDSSNWYLEGDVFLLDGSAGRVRRMPLGGRNQLLVGGNTTITKIEAVIRRGPAGFQALVLVSRALLLPRCFLLKVRC